ncbi:MAG: HAD family hydrolase [Clostridia bacterium]|nr:HAD family hydrolase [Clostridia bacterium]
MAQPMSRPQSRHSCVIWDYNGTIVDDAWVAVEAENIVLKAHGLPEMTMDFYRRECEMPIENFYNKIYDFSKYSFSEVAAAFLYNYDSIAVRAKPFNDVCIAIRKLHEQGIRQGVISGFETGRLIESLRAFGLDGYFEFMSGADDTSCGSKSGRAAEVVAKYGFPPEKTLFIGDMYHDYETAAYVGADCVLIARGHQSGTVLRSYGTVDVIDSTEKLENYI